MEKQLNYIDETFLETIEEELQIIEGLLNAS